MNEVFFLVLIIACILNFILFFKIWGMTNNLKRFLNFYVHEKGFTKKREGLDEYFIDKEGRNIDETF